MFVGHTLKFISNFSNIISIAIFKIMERCVPAFAFLSTISEFSELSHLIHTPVIFNIWGHWL